MYKQYYTYYTLTGHWNMQEVAGITKIEKNICKNTIMLFSNNSYIYIYKYKTNTHIFKQVLNRKLIKR